jgi:hypothetical protein
LVLPVRGISGSTLQYGNDQLQARNFRIADNTVRTSPWPKRIALAARLTVGEDIAWIRNPNESRVAS